MKKFFALLLTLAMLLSAMAALAETTEATATTDETAATEEAVVMEEIAVTAEEPAAEEEPETVEVTPGKVVGEWFAEFATCSEQKYFPTSEIKLVINRDKSGVLVRDGQEYSLKWTINDSRTELKLNLDDSSVFSYAPEATLTADNKLSFENMSDILNRYPTYLFTRENKTLQLPEAVKAEMEDNYFGNYKLAYVMQGSLAVLPDDDDSFDVRIDFAEAQIKNNYVDTVFVTEYDDGVLVVDITPSGSRNILGINDHHIVKLCKTADESLFMATVSNAEGEVAATFYLTKVD